MLIRFDSGPFLLCPFSCPPSSWLQRMTQASGQICSKMALLLDALKRVKVHQWLYWQSLRLDCEEPRTQLRNQSWFRFQIC